MTLHAWNEMQKKIPKRKHQKELKREAIIKGILKVAETVEKHQNEEPPKRFVEAAEMELFDAEGRPIRRWKGIVNKDDTEQMFNIVGRGYKIAQHDEVIKEIEDSLQELDLSHNQYVDVMNDGARIKAILEFPKIEATLSNGEKLNMRVTCDNSYDSTTGLRMIVGALNGTRILYTGKSFATFYHRHTKGMDTRNLKKKLLKGIDVFQQKIIEDFEKMISSQLDITKVLNFLDTCIKEKVIAVKYLEAIKDKISNTTSSQYDNQFALYNMIAEVLNAQVSSQEAQKNHMITMYHKVRAL